MSPEASGLKQEHEKVLKRALFVASGTLSSRILGLLRDMAIAALFSRTITDAWTVAFRIPNIFRRLFGEGAISASLIPAYHNLGGSYESDQKRFELLNSYLTYLFITLGVLSGLFFVFIEPTLGFLLSDVYWADPERRRLVIVYGRIMVGFVFFFGQYASFVSILNMAGRFALPAAAAGLLNVAMLVFTFMPSSWFFTEGEQLAWGVLVGGLLQSAVVYWGLHKIGARFRFSFESGERALLFLRNILLNAFSGGILQFTTLINLYFASQFEAGSISAFYWSDRLLEFPLALISMSLGSALLPSLSEAHSRGRQDFFRGPFCDSLISVSLLIFPCAIGLYLISENLVITLFFRGEFSVADVALTTSVVKMYALCALPLAFSRIGVTALQARQNYGQGFYAGLGALIFLGFVAVPLTKFYGLSGLLYANFLGYVVHALSVYALLVRADPLLLQKFDWKSFCRIIALTIAMGMIAYLLQAQLAQVADFVKLLTTFVAAGVFYGAGVVYFGLLKNLKRTKP